MSTKQTVFVGLSGGVDSSVAAYRLLRQGYEVVGVFIKVWHPDFLECNWEAERLDAMRVAAHLNIPFLTCDAEDRYRIDVGEYFVAEYSAGRTPNPDVMCNQHIKFGAFWDFAKARGANYIATGHYARNAKSNDAFHLLRGSDPAKDQSYFLWTITQNQLTHVLLPIGDTAKTDIRHEAQAAGLPTFAKKDSQGICFLGHVDIPEFLSHFIELTPGDVCTPEGEVVGEHQGALVYTIGQRHGFTISTNNTDRAPLYVIERDLDKNRLIVSPEKPQVPATTAIKLQHVHWISTQRSGQVFAQFRYRQTPFPVTINLHADMTELSISPQQSVEKPASGQSCVLYDGDECLGGGIIA